MSPRLLTFFLLLPCGVLAAKDPDDSLARYDFYLRRHYDNGMWNGGIGFSGGSLNFHQNGSVGLNCFYTYNLLELGRSSIWPGGANGLLGPCSGRRHPVQKARRRGVGNRIRGRETAPNTNRPDPQSMVLSIKFFEIR